MKVINLIFRSIIIYVVIFSAHATAITWPACQSANSDPDGDGFGWENNASCIVSTSGNSSASGSGKTQCTDPNSDPDGDGYGWENNASCVVATGGGSASGSSGSGKTECTDPNSDPDGDGFGWENNQSCVVTGEATTPSNSPYVYRENSPYAEKMMACAMVTDPRYSCALHELPFIALVNANPTVDQIMDRLVVSDDWMGQRFEQILNVLPLDLIRMFSSTTAVVITSKTNRSFVQPASGSMWIDPDFLWITTAEKQTIDNGRQSKADPDTGLQFREANYYSINGTTTYLSPRRGINQRTVANMVYSTARVLYHELAHVVDILPQGTKELVDYSGSFNDARLQFQPELSKRLNQLYPRGGLILSYLPRIVEGTATALDFERAFTAQDVGSYFADGGATTLYSYTNDYEDFANLVSYAMIKFHYNIDTNVSFYNIPESDFPTCQDFIIDWGVINRIANPYVSLRAEVAVKSAVATGSAIDDFFANGIGAESLDRVGQNYCF